MTMHPDAARFVAVCRDLFKTFLRAKVLEVLRLEPSKRVHPRSVAMEMLSGILRNRDVCCMMRTVLFLCCPGRRLYAE